MTKSKEVTHKLALLSGFGSTGGRSRDSSAFGFVRVAVGFGFGNLAVGGFGTTPANPPLSSLFRLFLVFLFSGLGNFDNNGTTVELLLVEGSHSLFGGLKRRKGDKTVTS